MGRELLVARRRGKFLWWRLADGDGVGLTTDVGAHVAVKPGETLRTWVDGIGEMVHTFR